MVAIPLGAFAQGQEHPKSSLPPMEMGLALSGGGVRAAAFSYGVMRGLNEIILCAKKNGGFIIEIDDIYLNNSLREKKPFKSKCEQPFEPYKLLAEINAISAVSGGTMTASYYMTHNDKIFLTKFRDVLRGKNLSNALLRAVKARSNFWGGMPLAPLTLITSALDIAKDIIVLPFSLVLSPFTDQKYGFPFSNPDLTPALFLAGGKGLVNVEQLAEIYQDWLFDGKKLNYKHAQKQRPNTELFINATDINNRLPFTFDLRTFRCLGMDEKTYKRFPIALAAASSSALPILFAPLKLEEHVGEFRTPKMIPSGCPTIWFSKELSHLPELLDGGIRENLGLATLIRNVFEEKNKGLHNHPLKSFIVIVNAAAPSVDPFFSFQGDSTLIQNVDQSLDTLQRDKTDLARTIYREPLRNFGFGSIELKFSDILKVPGLVRHMVQYEIYESSKNGKKEKIEEVLDNYELFTAMEQRIQNDLETVSMQPTQDQVDTLISAGRAIVEHQFHQIKSTLLGLSGRHFRRNCESIINPTKYYCWPEEFQIENTLEKPLRHILKEFSKTSEKFLQETTENRIQKLRDVQRIGLKLRRDLEVTANIYKLEEKMREIISREIEYYELIKDKKTVESLMKLLAQLDKEAIIEPAFDDAHAAVFGELPKTREERDEQVLLSYASSSLDALRAGKGPGFCDYSLEGINEEKAPKTFYCYLALNLLKEIDSSIEKHDIQTNHMLYLYRAMLSHFLGRTEDTYYNLYAGIKEYPDVASFRLRSHLGYVSFLRDTNVEGAIRQFGEAINIVRDNQRYLNSLGYKSLDRKSKTQIEKLTKLFKSHENWNKRQLAEYSSLVPGFSLKAGDISSEIVFGLNKDYPNDERDGTEIRVAGDGNGYESSLHLKFLIDVMAELEFGQKQEATKAKDYYIEKIKDFGKDYEGVLQSPFDSSKKEKQRQLQKLLVSKIKSVVGRKIKEGIRSENVGFRYAEEIFEEYFIETLRSLDRTKNEIQEAVPGLMQHEILYPYALHVLAANAQYECPDRGGGILESRKNLQDSKRLLLNAMKILVNQNRRILGKESDPGSEGKLKKFNEILNAELGKLEKDQLEFNYFESLVDSIFPTKSKEIEWSKSVAPFLEEDINNAENLRDVIVLLFDLKFLNLFLTYVDELECLEA